MPLVCIYRNNRTMSKGTFGRSVSYSSTSISTSSKRKTKHRKLEQNIRTTPYSEDKFGGDGLFTAAAAIQNISPASEEVLLIPNAASDAAPAVSEKYSIRKQREFEKWERLRPLLLNATIESCAPFQYKCVECSTSQACVYCHSCGPLYFTCEDCAEKTHKYRPFHDLRIWNVCIKYN